MAVKYPNMFNIRLTHEDRKQLWEASEKAEIPPSTLARRVLRQWLRSAEAAAAAVPTRPDVVCDYSSSNAQRKSW